MVGYCEWNLQCSVKTPWDHNLDDQAVVDRDAGAVLDGGCHIFRNGQILAMECHELACSYLRAHYFGDSFLHSLLLIWRDVGICSVE